MLCCAVLCCAVLCGLISLFMNLIYVRSIFCISSSLSTPGSAMYPFVWKLLMSCWLRMYSLPCRPTLGLCRCSVAFDSCECVVLDVEEAAAVGGGANAGRDAANDVSTRRGAGCGKHTVAGDNRAASNRGGREQTSRDSIAEWSRVEWTGLDWTGLGWAGSGVGLEAH